MIREKRVFKEYCDMFSFYAVCQTKNHPESWVNNHSISRSSQQLQGFPVGDNFIFVVLSGSFLWFAANGVKLQKWELAP